jgi:phage baseplate assembly protein W
VAVKTLALSGGDLVIGPGGLQLVSGAAKIRQDLALALSEEYGTDPYHPEWGSVLPRYVGQPVDSDTKLLVQAEVNRVVQQYMAGQQARLSAATTSNQATTMTTSDVVRSMDGIDVVVEYDFVRILITLTTMSGQTLNVTRTVTQ